MFEDGHTQVIRVSYDWRVSFSILKPESMV